MKTFPSVNRFVELSAILRHSAQAHVSFLETETHPPLPLAGSPSYPTVHLPSRQRGSRPHPMTRAPLSSTRLHGQSSTFDPAQPATPQTDDRQQPTVEVTNESLSPLNQSPKIQTEITSLQSLHCDTKSGHRFCITVRPW